MELNENGSGRSTWRERERERAKKEIIDAAAELFARKGFEDTSMKDIAERADLSVGKLYHHFEGKSEIIREILEEYVNEMSAVSEAACVPDDPPLEQLRCRIRASIEHLKEHRNFIRIYLRESPFRFKGMVKEEMRKNREIAAGLFAGAVDRGDIPKEDPYVLTDITFGAMHNLLHMMCEDERDEMFDSVPDIIDRIILKPLEMKKKNTTGMEGS